MLKWSPFTLSHSKSSIFWWWAPGPPGLACAIEAQKAGFRTVLVDKGCVCNSLFHYPAHMTFFTTPELLEIGDIPFPSPNPKPTRNEALQYYRLVAAYYKLDVRQYHRVERVTAPTALSRCTPRTASAGPALIQARKLASPPATTTCPTT
jgi:thioredoxin reductase (NADPH)